ncbi:hypothetical protein FGB62_169g01 [Gracilaria domingensis]|nr:hypothetical protein FGB62_169g01 [Gracilaria domingensis]
MHRGSHQQDMDERFAHTLRSDLARKRGDHVDQLLLQGAAAQRGGGGVFKQGRRDVALKVQGDEVSARTGAPHGQHVERVLHDVQRGERVVGAVDTNLQPVGAGHGAVRQQALHGAGAQVDEEDGAHADVGHDEPRRKLDNAVGGKRAAALREAVPRQLDGVKQALFAVHRQRVNVAQEGVGKVRKALVHHHVVDQSAHRRVARAQRLARLRVVHKHARQRAQRAQQADARDVQAAGAERQPGGAAVERGRHDGGDQARVGVHQQHAARAELRGEEQRARRVRHALHLHARRQRERLRARAREQQRERDEQRGERGARGHCRRRGRRAGRRGGARRRRSRARRALKGAARARAAAGYAASKRTAARG